MVYVLPVDITQLTVIETHIHQKLLTQTWGDSSALDEWQGTDEKMGNLEGEKQSGGSILKISFRVWGFNKLTYANGYGEECLASGSAHPQTSACSLGNGEGPDMKN